MKPKHDDPYIMAACMVICLLFLFFVGFCFAIAQRNKAYADNYELMARIEELESRELVVVVERPEPEPEPENQSLTAEISSTEAVLAIDDVDLLARLIYCEIGSDGHPDEQLYNVGSVVMNRVADTRFPDTIRGVIYQPGQYAPAISGVLEAVTPTKRCYTIAADLLANGSRLPESVVWQSTVPQGTEIYETYYSPLTGTTTYYCR